MSEEDRVYGPYIVWIDYGCEGWKPCSYDTLKEALLAHKWGHGFRITKVIDFEVTEKDESSRDNSS